MKKKLFCAGTLLLMNYAVLGMQQSSKKFTTAPLIGTSSKDKKSIAIKTKLHSACENLEINLVETLCQQGANVNKLAVDITNHYCDYRGITPLEIVASIKSPKSKTITQILCNNGAQLDRAFRIAIAAGNVGIIQLLEDIFKIKHTDMLADYKIGYQFEPYYQYAPLISLFGENFFDNGINKQFNQKIFNYLWPKTIINNPEMCLWCLTIAKKKQFLNAIAQYKKVKYAKIPTMHEINDAIIELIQENNNAQKRPPQSRYQGRPIK